VREIIRIEISGVSEAKLSKITDVISSSIIEAHKKKLIDNKGAMVLYQNNATEDAVDSVPSSVNLYVISKKESFPEVDTKEQAS